MRLFLSFTQITFGLDDLLDFFFFFFSSSFSSFSFSRTWNKSFKLCFLQRSCVNWIVSASLFKSNDHIYGMVKESNSNIQHCIWPIRTHYTFVSANEQLAPNEDVLAMVQQPSIITILYMYDHCFQQTSEDLRFLPCSLCLW